MKILPIKGESAWAGLNYSCFELTLGSIIAELCLGSCDHDRKFMHASRCDDAAKTDEQSQSSKLTGKYDIDACIICDS